MKISVIIPAYNAGETLAETLDSVLAQSCKAYEVIVVDDGSTDTTVAIATSHSLMPKVISTANHGAASALNLGIKSATGDVLTFLDADDLWLETKIEMQSAVLVNEPQVDMVFSCMEAFLCPGLSPDVAVNLAFPEGSQPGYLIGTLMVRRDVFSRNGFFDPALRTGYFIDWFSRVRSEGGKLKMLPQTHLKRRIRRGTLGQRQPGANDPLSSDFLEIARRSILRKRNTNDNAN